MTSGISRVTFHDRELSGVTTINELNNTDNAISILPGGAAPRGQAGTFNGNLTRDWSTNVNATLSMFINEYIPRHPYGADVRITTIKIYYSTSNADNDYINKVRLEANPMFSAIGDATKWEDTTTQPGKGETGISDVTLTVDDGVGASGVLIDTGDVAYEFQFDAIVNTNVTIWGIDITYSVE